MRFFAPAFGDIVAEVKADTFEELVGEYTLIGEVTNEKAFAYGDVKIGMDDALDAWTKPLEKVFATKSAESSDIPVEEKLYDASTYMCAAIRSDSLRCLFRYSRVQTVSMTVRGF